MTHPVYIIQGAQWGSEGKGQIAAIYAREKKAVAAVRTGSINAGHTVYFRGQSFKMQLLPTAWTILPENKNFWLILGPGCYISPDILVCEVDMIRQATGLDIRSQLLIDYRCTLHTKAHQSSAAFSRRHHEIGATGKGSSDAVIDRMISRCSVPLAENLLFANNPITGGFDFKKCITDTTKMLHSLVHRHGPVVLEGTQGAHLDFLTGPYPYTTNRCVSTAAWLAYAGLPPTLDIRPILVTRTYPIRVAGNSGPMPNEITWPKLYRIIMAKLQSKRRWPKELAVIKPDSLTQYEAHLQQLIREAYGPEKTIEHWTREERYQHRVILSEAPTRAWREMPWLVRDELSKFFEMTTVTNKIRRVALLDGDMVEAAIRLNGCYEMWLTFLNYEFPSLWGTTDVERVKKEAGAYLRQLSDRWAVPIVGVSTEREAQHHLRIDQ